MRLSGGEGSEFIYYDSYHRDAAASERDAVSHSRGEAFKVVQFYREQRKVTNVHRLSSFLTGFFLDECCCSIFLLSLPIAGI